MRISEAAARMSSRADLEHAGMSARAITLKVRDQALHRIDRGWYLDKAEWQALYPEDRHLLRVVAADRRRPTDSPSVYVLCSAAVLHDLPLARVEPLRVHVAGKTGNGHVRASRPLIARHEIPMPEADTTRIGGFACTSLARTVADMIRVASEETSIALLDAAIRRRAWDEETREYDVDAAAAFVADVRRLLPPGGRGVRRARFLLDIGNGLAQSPGESISRLYLLRLGFATPRLQVAIPGPGSSSYYVDFGLDDVDAWGEFDGEGKYRDAAMRRDDQTAEDVLLEEKQREDWIRGTTNRRFARWMNAHITTEAALRQRLAAFSIHPG